MTVWWRVTPVSLPQAKSARAMTIAIRSERVLVAGAFAGTALTLDGGRIAALRAVDVPGTRANP